ncbi:hypothetical protein QZH41_020042 [Actinostola sp. cb2023]|nr:hypothetical protein QZH41_020042 [Actinostola sp. cb2023]
MEAIGHAGTCLGILANDGIVLAAERRNTNKLLDEVFVSEKIYKLHEDMACSVAGITSDANVLTNELRLIAQRYELQYQEPIPCEQMVSALCDVKQAYTQFGGMYLVIGYLCSYWVPCVMIFCHGIPVFILGSLCYDILSCVFSYTRVILVVTIVDGKAHVLATTV